MRAAVLALALLLWAPLAHAVAVDPQPLADPAAEARAHALMRQVRCLVCQNQSIEDSDAELAADLRAAVRARVAAGDDDEAVKAWLVARYGDWVLLKPPVKPATWALWATPALLLLIGGFVAARRLSRRAALPQAPLDAEEAAALARLERGEP